MTPSSPAEPHRCPPPVGKERVALWAARILLIALLVTTVVLYDWQVLLLVLAVGLGASAATRCGWWRPPRRGR